MIAYIPLAKDQGVLRSIYKIEAVIEDYGLAKLMDEADDEEPLSLSVAHNYYATLKKKA